MTSITSAAVFGSTGHSGQYILASLVAMESIKTVYTFTRRAPKIESPKLAARIERDSSKWASNLLAIEPPPNVVLSALAMTHAEAGSVSNKWKIDHDLNVELAKAAKKAGVKTYVFISGAGARSALGAYISDMKMKKGVEETIEELGFENAVILRPGMILGRRETPHPIGPLLNGIIYGLGSIAKSLQDNLGQEAEVVGRAAVQAAQIATESKAPSKVWVIEGGDIVKLGNSVQ
ncbi:hypothetical protein E0Z10_g6031 [Xylaria hypoxylon]|uniref:NAD(P)-binding domain-containing protein n=1 Tax=Xylaria hypoxylon TaxID=37992 RepID=A0A4Z0YZJ3_9PEZI|nr:hypothetical protein E0Z10_g6031 [Xylaria hypoxylon]